MLRNQVHNGLLIRLLRDYSNVPAGTPATVNAVGTMIDGSWWFTVRWHTYKPIPNKFPRDAIEYSLNLWEPDLTLFEVITSGNEQGARKSRQHYPESSKPRLEQLSLPFGDYE